LLETILAVSLLAVLLMLMGSAIRIYSRLVTDRRADVVSAQIARAVLHRVAEDLRATFYAKQEGGQGGGLGDDGGELSGSDGASAGGVTTTDLTASTAQATPGVYGNEFELQLDVLGRFAKPVKYDNLVAMGLDPQSVNLWSDPKIVTYYLRPSNPSELVGTPLEVFDSTATEQRNVLIRRVQSRAQAIYSTAMGDPNAVQQGEQLLSDQVVGLAFEFFDGLQWLSQWDSELDGGLPVAVRVTLTIVDAHEVSAGSSVGAMDSPAGDTYQITVSLPTAGTPAADVSTL
jgi:hypothetical protein